MYPNTCNCTLTLRSEIQTKYILASSTRNSNWNRKEKNIINIAVIFFKKKIRTNNVITLESPNVRKFVYLGFLSRGSFCCSTLANSHSNSFSGKATEVPKINTYWKYKSLLLLLSNSNIKWLKTVYTKKQKLDQNAERCNINESQNHTLWPTLRQQIGTIGWHWGKDQR